MERLYRRALRGPPEALDGMPPLWVPDGPAFTLAELLASEPDDSGPVTPPP